MRPNTALILYLSQAGRERMNKRNGVHLGAMPAYPADLCGSRFCGNHFTRGKGWFGLMVSEAEWLLGPSVFGCGGTEHHRLRVWQRRLPGRRGRTGGRERKGARTDVTLGC